MGDPGAAATAALRLRTQAQVADAPHRRGDLVHHAGRLCLGHAAGRLSAIPDGVSLVCPVPDDGTWEQINHHLVMQDRERVGRAASPSAAVIDSQSAKTAEAGGPRGYDAGKKGEGGKGPDLGGTG